MTVFLFLALTGCDQITEWTGGTPQTADSGPPPVLEVGGHKTPEATTIQSLITPGPPVGISSNQCTQVTDGGPVNGPDCVTQDVKCGDTIVGHTRGGVKKYDTKFYEQNFCWPGTVNRNGGDERIYRFVANDQATKPRYNLNVYLDTPCAGLDVTLMQYSEQNRCPNPGDAINICDTAYRPNGKTREHLKQLIDPDEVWYILVEGVDEEEGPFSLSVECGA